MMGHREKTKDGDEYDLTCSRCSRRGSGWKKVKKRINKRIRRQQRLLLKLSNYEESVTEY